MAVVKTMSNHYKYQLGIGNIDYETDVLKMILMNSAFTFDKDTHSTLALVTSNQIAAGFGYV